MKIKLHQKERQLLRKLIMKILLYNPFKFYVIYFVLFYY